MKLFTLAMVAMFLSFASFGQTPAITPSTGSLCVGQYLPLADSMDPGGTWQSSSATIATIGSSDGYLYGVSSGVVSVTYTVAGLSAYGSYTVNPVPAPIGGGPSLFCAGTTPTYTDATPGGVWSTSSYTGSASINPATGMVTGSTPGVFYVIYTLPAGCSVSSMDTFNSTTAYPIAGPTTVCVGSSIALSDSFGTGGVWSSSTPGVGTISATGVVTGISAGTTTISLTFTGICGSASSTQVVTVTTGSVGPISGPATVTAGGTGSYSASPGGGTWTISPTTVATIDASGTVTGVSTGTAIITYSATSCGTLMTATMIVTVTALDGISGNVIFSTPYYGNVKVWLITYNPGTSLLEAYDSVTNYCSGTTVYYQFTGIPSDSFRVKAAVPDSTGSTTSFIPTYHSSYFYWHDANVINHVSGTSDIHEDITMLTGTPVSGPGFISGSVLTGANKGTSGSIPVVGLHMVALTSSGSVAQMAYTDATGTYTLGNLPVGTYTVFPDSLNYITTPYTSITITSGAPTFSAAAFTQHTVSKTITPGAESVKNLSSVSSVTAFPNPTSGRLNIMWNEATTEKASVVITDITGRQVYTTTLTLTDGKGISPIDLSALNSGLYMLNIKTATLSYNNKIDLQR